MNELIRIFLNKLAHISFPKTDFLYSEASSSVGMVNKVAAEKKLGNDKD